MVNTENARPFDAVIGALQPEEIDKLRLKDEVLLQGVKGIRELDGAQKTSLSEAIVRRSLAASKDKKIQLIQRMSAQMFESGEESFFGAALKDFTGETSDFDITADIILGLKSKLSSSKGSRRGATNSPQEDLAEMVSFSADEAREFAVNNPEYMERIAQTYGVDGDVARNMMNFYSVDYLLDQGKDSQVAWDKYRKKFTLFSIPGGLDETTYGKLLEEDWLQPSPENEEMVRRVQAWQLMVDLLAVRSGPYAQVAQQAHRQYPSLGIFGSTYPATMMMAAQKVEAFAQEINWSTEEVAEHLVKVTATGNELSSLLHGVRKPIIFETADGRTGSFEISVAGAMDQFVGNRAQIVKNGEGKPLYSFRGSIGPGANARTINVEGKTLEEIFNGLTPAEQTYVQNSEWLVPMWDRDLTGRLVEGQQLYTWTDTIRGENGKGALLDWVIRQVETQGVKIEDITSLWATAEDGAQLTKKHDLYRLRYQKTLGELKRKYQISPPPEMQTIIDRYVRDGANLEWAQNMAMNEIGEGPAKREAAKNLLADTVITAYGRYADLGFGMMDMLGHSDLFDVRQLLDNLPELTNKAMTGFAYDEKYTILPATMRKMVQSYIRTVLSWKRKDVDPILVSLFGKNGVTAAWRDPLQPEKAPLIPEVKLRDGRRLSELRGSARPVIMGDLSIPEDQLYTDITTAVEAIFYLKSDWRTGSMTRQNIANHLVLLSQQMGGKDGKIQAMKYFDDYIKDYNGQAPQEFPRARDEVALVLQSLLRTRRESLNFLDWKEPLRAMGYENLNLNNEEYFGVRGLEKLAEMRSSNQWMTGEIQKMFKYMSKYPGLAVAETKALGKLVPTLNNALHPFFESMLGGMPDQMKNLEADAIGEALAKGFVNVLFMGTRNQKAAGNYIKEVIESTIESMNLIGYMSGADQRKDVRDVVMTIEAFCDKALDMCEYDYMGGDQKGEHGSSRAWLEIKEPNLLKEKEIVTTLRMAGFTVTFPNNSLTSDVDIGNLIRHGQVAENMLPDATLSEAENSQRQTALTARLKELGVNRSRKPYISWGIQPQFLEKGGVLSEGGLKLNRSLSKQEVLGLYGHLGKETLMTIILMEYLQDKLLMTELDASRVLVDLAKRRGAQPEKALKLWKIFRAKKDQLLEEMDRAEIERLRLENAQRNNNP